MFTLDRVFENGRETITVHEDGVLKSKTINDTPAAAINGIKAQKIQY